MRRGKKAGEDHARRALALGSDDSTVLTYAGWVLLIAGRTALDRATSLNPNQSLALAYRSIGLAITGEPKASETPTRRCA